METNFFQSLAGLNIKADLQIGISMMEGQMAVSFQLRNKELNDDARKLIPPMVLTASPAELDSHFFSRIQSPVVETDKLFSNMEQYQKALEMAAKQSKAGQAAAKNEKQEKDDAKKQKSDHKKRYDELMQAVAALEDQKLFKEAIDSLPDIKEFPEQADEINKRNLQLLQKNITQELF